jgi:hypothetical protein
MNDSVRVDRTSSQVQTTKNKTEAIAALEDGLSMIRDFPDQITPTDTTNAFLGRVDVEKPDKYTFAAVLLAHLDSGELDKVNERDRVPLIYSLFSYYAENNSSRDNDSLMANIDAGKFNSVINRLFPSSLAKQQSSLQVAAAQAPTNTQQNPAAQTETRRSDAALALQDPNKKDVDPKTLTDLEDTAIRQQMKPLLDNHNLQPLYLSRIIKGVTGKAQPEGKLLDTLIKHFGLKQQGNILVEDPDAPKPKPKVVPRPDLDAENARLKAKAKKRTPSSSKPSATRGKPPLAKTISDKERDQIIEFVDSIIKNGKINYTKLKNKVAQILNRPNLGLETTKKLLQDLGYNINKGKTEALRASAGGSKKIIPSTKVESKSDIQNILVDFDSEGSSLDEVLEQLGWYGFETSPMDEVDLSDLDKEDLAGQILGLTDENFDKDEVPELKGRHFDQLAKTEILLAALTMFEPDTLGAVLREDNNFDHFINNLKSL